MSGRGKLHIRRKSLAIRRESSWFSAGDCFAMAASMSKSMPAQNALPLPVTMATRAWLFSIASSAVCNSAIIWVEMALRFSGRFSVMVARFPVISRRSVEYIFENTSSIHERSMRILRANLIRHFEYLRQARGINARIGARFSQRCKDILGRDVPDQIVSRKGASAKPGQRPVEPPASRFVGCENFLFRVLRPAVQMNSEPDAGDVILHAAVQVADKLRRSGAHGVRQRNCSHANIF